MSVQDCSTVISLLGNTLTTFINTECSLISSSLGFVGEVNDNSFKVKFGKKVKDKVWVEQDYKIINENGAIPNIRNFIYIIPQVTPKNIISSIKNNPTLEIDNSFKRNYKDEEFYVKDIKNFTIETEVKSFYVKTKELEDIINPEIEFPTEDFFVKGESDSKGDACEGNIKGFEFIAQKGTYIELSLDFVKEDLTIDTITGLPDGLFFRNGKIRGTPSLSGEYMFNINISDGSIIECKIVIPQLIRLL